MPCAMSAAMRLTMTGKYDTGNGNGNGMVILMMAPLFLNGLFLLAHYLDMYVHMSNELPLFMYTFINSLYILTYMQKMYVKKTLYIHKYVCIKFF